MRDITFTPISLPEKCGMHQPYSRTLIRKEDGSTKFRWGMPERELFFKLGVSSMVRDGRFLRDEVRSYIRKSRIHPND